VEHAEIEAMLRASLVDVTKRYHDLESFRENGTFEQKLKAFALQGELASLRVQLTECLDAMNAGKGGA